MDFAKLTLDLKKALQELLESAQLKEGNIVVVGCSTSEISGHSIGSASSMEIAAAIMEGLSDVCRENRFYLAIQCCEHLNRALVVESECQTKYNLEEVTVYPVQKAGGSLAAQALKSFHHPVVVEKIQAHAGLDIGDTFIGMHLRPVAVPVRSTVSKIGSAHLTMARTRPKLIGGERAKYQCI